MRWARVVELARAAVVEGTLVTCIVACRVPGKGAVIACESRVTAGTEIITDACDKWMVCGTVVLAIAGHDGGLVQALTGSKNLPGVLKAAAEYSSAHNGLNWQIIGYDMPRDQLLQLDSDGALIVVERKVTAGGSGGSYALGWLEAQRAPKTLGAAARSTTLAVRAAIKRDCACGGRVRVLSIPKNGAITVR